MPCICYPECYGFLLVYVVYFILVAWLGLKMLSVHIKLSNVALLMRFWFVTVTFVMLFNLTNHGQSNLDELGVCFLFCFSQRVYRQ